MRRVAKKLGLAVLVVALLGGASLALASARGTYRGYPVVGVVVNGRELKPDVPAVVMDGRTLLPVRAVSEALGAKVEWDQATYTAKVTLPREVTAEELSSWQQDIINKLGAFWDAYGALLKDKGEGRVDQAKFLQQMVDLCRQAQEVLRLSASVTSSDPELWGQAVGSSAVAALAYADAALQLGAASNPGMHESAQLAHQAMVKLMESQGAVPGPAVDQALFAQYFAKLSLGRLPPEYAGREDWPLHVVATNVFSRGDAFVTMGEVRKEVQLVAGVYDVKAGRYVREPVPGGPVLKPGGFAGASPLDLPPGEYELRCFVGETLVAVLPFTVR